MFKRLRMYLTCSSSLATVSLSSSAAPDLRIVAPIVLALPSSIDDRLSSPHQMI
ncbi:unnamed protein product, partial [Brassica rapa subsp. trilocularis]